MRKTLLPSAVMGGLVGACIAAGAATATQPFWVSLVCTAIGCILAVVILAWYARASKADD